MRHLLWNLYSFNSIYWWWRNNCLHVDISINKRVLIDWWQIYKASIESKIVIYWLLNRISVFIDFYRKKNVHDLIFKRANHLNQHFNSKYFEYLCMFVYWYSRKSKSVLIKIFLFHFSFQVSFITTQSKNFDSYLKWAIFNILKKEEKGSVKFFITFLIYTSLTSKDNLSFYAYTGQPITTIRFVWIVVDWRKSH